MNNKTTHMLHPWHGISIGKDVPNIVNAFIEALPTDVVKYEIDKESGHLKVDRPQRYSSQCPALYGFLPQTFCADRTAARCMEVSKLTNIQGDGDPLDICVFSERQISQNGVLVRAKPIGGLRMIDRSQADDKILAVLVDDALYSGWNDIDDIPEGLLTRVKHYFLTYKQAPDNPSAVVTIAEVYNRDEAYNTISRSIADYKDNF